MDYFVLLEHVFQLLYRGIHKQEILMKNIDEYMEQLTDSYIHELESQYENQLLDSDTSDSIS